MFCIIGKQFDFLRQTSITAAMFVSILVTLLIALSLVEDSVLEVKAQFILSVEWRFSSSLVILLYSGLAFSISSISLGLFRAEMGSRTPSKLNATVE